MAEQRMQLDIGGQGQLPEQADQDDEDEDEAEDAEI